MVCQNFHHYVTLETYFHFCSFLSTEMVQDVEFSLMEDRFTLMIDVMAVDDLARQEARPLPSMPFNYFLHKVSVSIPDGFNLKFLNFTRYTSACLRTRTIFTYFFKTLIPAWICNHKPIKVWDEITHPFPNFNSCTVEVREWICNCIPYFIMDVISYPSCDYVKRC